MDVYEAIKGASSSDDFCNVVWGRRLDIRRAGGYGCLIIDFQDDKPYRIKIEKSEMWNDAVRRTT